MRVKRLPSAKTLLSSFGENIRAATIEFWSTELSNHVDRVLGDSIMGEGIKSLFESNLPGLHRNTFSMWRNIFLASDLRQQYESKHGCQYDVVIRARPDMTTWDQFVFEDWASHLSAHMHTVIIGCRDSSDKCLQRVQQGPDSACWLDDELAVGTPDAMSAYEQLLPDFARFFWWWFPKFGAVAAAWKNFPERLLLAHLDWRVKAAENHQGPPFLWSYAGPSGAPIRVGIDHRYRGHGE